MSTRTRSIDLKRLSLCDALDLAKLIEEEARERYDELAHQMEQHRNHDAARFFRFMCRIEGIHADKLAARRKELFGDAASKVRREMIFDVEAPEYDEVRATMTVRQALDAALRAEKKAYTFFDEALAVVAEPELRSLFTELRADEVEHAGLIEQEIAKLPPEDPIKAEDVEDEPVAH